MDNLIMNSHMDVALSPLPQPRSLLSGPHVTILSQPFNRNKILKTLFGAFLTFVSIMAGLIFKSF